MSKNCLLIVCMICEFFKISVCEKKNSTSWSTVNLLIDGREYDNSTHRTTETHGIIIKTTNDSYVTNSNDHWTKIDVTVPPQRSSVLSSRYHATLANPITIARSTTVTGERSINFQTTGKHSTQVPTPSLLNTTTESTDEISLKTSRKGVNGETGHAFFYDDDDDDDDDYDDDDDEYVQKKGDDEEEEEEEVVDDDKNVEEAAEAVDTEGQEEYENYAETRPPIILRTRRKNNKKKRGKKHGHIKIKDFKKLRKFMLPLLLAYKLKFFTLVPLLLGGLVLIVATTGFAGFFFALFAVGLGLKHHH